MLRSTLLLAACLAAAGLSGCDTLTGSDDGAEVDRSERLYPVRVDGDPALIDKTGRVVATLDGYSEAKPGRQGLVPARRWAGRTYWDFFDADGEVAFSIAADGVEAPSQDRVRFWVDGRSGFVDLEGRFVVNPYLNDARSFREDVARVKTTGWRWGLMGRDGDIVVEPEWGGLSDFSGGRARFENDGAYGFIDATGAEVIPAVYDDARDFRGGRAAVRQGQRWFYIDASDTRLMGSTTFISAGDFGDGLAPVRTENLWEYVDESGARRIDPQFEEARAFVDGRAAVKLDGRWTFIDPDGRQLAAPSYDEVDDFDGGLARVVTDEKTGYIDRDGKAVWIPRD